MTAKYSCRAALSLPCASGRRASRGGGRSRSAIACLESSRETELVLPCVALGEYLEGFDDPRLGEARALVWGIHPLEWRDCSGDAADSLAATSGSGGWAAAPGWGERLARELAVRAASVPDSSALTPPSYPPTTTPRCRPHGRPAAARVNK